MFQPLSLCNPRCHSITPTWIQYRLKGTEKWPKEYCDTKNTTSMLSPPSDGTYEIYMTVQNNEGVSSSNEMIHIYRYT